MALVTNESYFVRANASNFAKISVSELKQNDTLLPFSPFKVQLDYSTVVTSMEKTFVFHTKVSQKVLKWIIDILWLIKC